MSGRLEVWFEFASRSGRSRARTRPRARARARLLASACGDLDALLARPESGENKQKLRERTDTAPALGIFAAPTFVARGEIFWGNDRLEAALAWCARTSAS